MRILIVDDLEPTRKLLRVTLEAEGVEVVQAADGVEALAVLNRDRVDGIISDVLMPNMDGYRLCREVRNDPRFSALPFIVYSATYGSLEAEDLGIQFGADRVFNKPSRAAVLIAALEEIIKSRPGGAPVAAQSRDELTLMKQYSAQLVDRLEEKTYELTAQAEALRGMREKLERLLAKSPAVIYSLTVHGERTSPAYVSENFAQIIGSETVDFFQENWWEDHLHPDEREKVMAGLPRLFARGQLARDYRLRRADGAYAWVREEQRLVRDADGWPIEIVGSWTDITERVLADQRLDLQHSITKVLAEASGSSVAVERALQVICERTLCVNGEFWEVDAETKRLRCQRCWPAASVDDSASAAEQRASLGIGEGLAGKVWASGEAAWESESPHDVGMPRGRVSGPFGGGAAVAVPVRFQSEARGVMVFFWREIGSEDESLLNLLTGLGVQLGQFLERKLLEEERAHLATELQLLLESTGEGIYGLDAKARCTFINRSGARMLGYAPEELLGRETHPLIHHAKLDGTPYPRHECPIARSFMLAEGCRVDDEVFWRKDGTSFPVAYSSAPMIEKGVVRGVVVTFTDTTEERERQARSLRDQRLESIGALAGGIAHDLNNALAPILMATQLLRMKFGSPEDQPMLEILESSALRGADMVKQVLTFARGIEGLRVPLDAKALIHDMASIARQTFPKTIRIESDVPENLWPVVADATQLHQVLLNLCINARDAMPDGGVLTIGATNLDPEQQSLPAHPDARPAPYLALRVADTGGGIPAELRERIFEPFFTTKELGKGTGLGLSTVRAIARSHEGFVTVESEIGRGACFKVYLPAQATAAIENDATLRRPLPVGNGQCILVVDDEAMIRNIARQTFEAFGYQVLTAAHGAEAVAVCAQNQGKISVMVTDLSMPVMDGLAAARAVRSFDSKIKIVIASGTPFDADEAAREACGIVYVLQKPFTAEKLLVAIEEALAPDSAPPDASL